MGSNDIRYDGRVAIVTGAGGGKIQFQFNYLHTKSATKQLHTFY